MNERFYQFINDYDYISKEYSRITNDSLNSSPITSVNNNPIKNCQYKVSIIIASWNSSKSLVYTLKSIGKSNLINRFPMQVEVIVVDDGSDDNINVINDYLPLACEVKYYRQQHMGRAQAVNLAIYKASGDIIVFCDADIIIPFRALDELIKRQQLFLNEAIFFGFRQDVDSGFVENCELDILLHDVKVNFEKDNRFLTDFGAGWGTNIMLETNKLNGMTCKENIYVSDNKVACYDCWQIFRMVYGFFFSISKKNLLKVGGFAEYLVGWGCDDTEVAAKAILNDIKIVPVPSAFVFHIYHDIRTKSQWEDGKKNEKRMNEHIENLSFENYITPTLENRVRAIRYYEPVQVVEEDSMHNYKFSCVHSNIEYHYLLGNNEISLELLMSKLLKSHLSEDDEIKLLDLLIRLNRWDLYRNSVKQKIRNKKALLYKLAEFVFYDNIDFSLWRDEYKEFALRIGVDELCKRAELYFNSEQWYLALRDYFAVLLLNSEYSETVFPKCKMCKVKMGL